MPLKINVNGTETAVEDCDTVTSLIQVLGLKADRLAIEHNGKIIRRAEWDHTRLAEGDRLEIVHFVGGGSR